MRTPPLAPKPTSPASPGEKQLQFLSIDLVARSTAPALLFIYGVGFVILGFYDAKFGVVQFSPFRTRILLVGFVFAAFVALAVAAQHYGFHNFALTSLHQVSQDSDLKRRPYRDTISAAAFILTATAISNTLGLFLFFHNFARANSTQSTWHRLFYIALTSIGFAIFWAASKTYPRSPGLAVLFSLIAAAMFVIPLLDPGFSTPSTYLTLMLYLVGWYTTWIKGARSSIAFALDFRLLPLAVIVLWIYISQVFGFLPPRWGGGQPTPAQIFQNTPVSWSQSNPMDVLLLDETDQGFYVLLSPNGRAFFVPRSTVSSILFGSKEDLPKKP